MTKIGEALQFFRDNDWRSILARLNSRDTHPLIQFIKYAISGVLAGVAHNGSVVLLIWLFLPATKGMLVNGVALDDATRSAHLILANIIACPVGLVVSYIANIRWVFTPGRHSKVKEFILFAIVAAIGFFPGLFVVDWLAHHIGQPSIVAQMGRIVTAVLVNFICREFIIFKH